MSKKIQIRSEKLEGAEVSWFAPICDGDDRYLGERNIKYKTISLIINENEYHVTSLRKDLVSFGRSA